MCNFWLKAVFQAFKMSDKTLFGFLCVVTLIYPSDCSDHTKTYPHNVNGVQITCYLCKPGQFFKDPCSKDGGESVCEACPVGQYNSHHGRATNCAPCDPECKDPEREEVEKNCSATSNISCVCKEGFYRVNRWSQLCTSLDECPPGKGVKKRGNRYNNTVCELCVPGYYSGITSKTESCQRCTKCSMNETAISECTSTNNTICAPKEKEKTEKDYTVLIIICIGICVLLATTVCCIIYRKRVREYLKEKVCQSKSVSSDEEMYDTEKRTGEDTEHLMNGHNIPNGKSSNGVTVSDNTEETIFVGENYLTVNELNHLKDDLAVPEYPTFCRRLFEEGADKYIDEMKLNYDKYGVKEIVYRILVAWQRVDKEKATKAKVLKTLEEMGWNDKKEKYGKLWELSELESES